MIGMTTMRNAILDAAIVMQSACRGDTPPPGVIDTRWRPDGCTCRACRRPKIVDSSRDAFRPTGEAPPFAWAGRVFHVSDELIGDESWVP